MEKEQSRVMAYRLAKEIDHAELEQISGGTSSITHKYTARPTAPDGAIDGQLDASVDW